jgi:c-di-GMP-binding flagellar brake protein YcgR
MASELGKRHFYRLEFPLDVTVKLLPAGEATKTLPLPSMQTRNISKGGICLETNSIEVDGIHLLSGAPFARENLLELTINLIPGEPPFQATGEVRWYEIARDIPGVFYRVGVAFIDVDGNGKSQLTRFVKNQKSSEGFFKRIFPNAGRR